MAIQADRALGRSKNPWGGEGTSNVVVIICLHLVGVGLTGLQKSEWPPCLPDSYDPGWRQNDFPVTTLYTMQGRDGEFEPGKVQYSTQKFLTGCFL